MNQRILLELFYNRAANRWDVFCQTYEHWLYCVARKFLGEENAYDAVQDCLASLIEKDRDRNIFQEVRNIRQYMYTTMVRVCMKILQKMHVEWLVIRYGDTIPEFPSALDTIPLYLASHKADTIPLGEFGDVDNRCRHMVRILTKFFCNEVGLVCNNGAIDFWQQCIETNLGPYTVARECDYDPQMVDQMREIALAECMSLDSSEYHEILRIFFHEDIGIFAASRIVLLGEHKILALLQCLDKLPKKLQEILYLIFTEGHRPIDVGKMMFPGNPRQIYRVLRGSKPDKPGGILATLSLCVEKTITVVKQTE
jgi:DNA-directed RNA polymerase specialized sigma24 family protein